MKIVKLDVLVIGAGPAGSVSSAYLNQQGRKVLVVEKQKFPRFVIGESLLPRCMDHLEEVGFLEEVKKAGFQEKTGATFYDKDTKCSFLFSEQFTEGWSWTYQVQRSKFDKVLIDTAQKQGVEVNFEHEVVAVDFSKEKKLTTIKDETGELYQVESSFVIDSSGYGRVLPRLLDLSKASDFEARSAVFAHLKNNFKHKDQRLDNIIVLSIDEDKTWLWFIPFSDNTTSVGVVGKNENLGNLIDLPIENYESFLKRFDLFNDIFSKTEFVFEPKSINGFSIGVKQLFGDGYALCGNSTEFLDPVFSSGVTMAMESGMQTAKLVHRQLNGESVDWQTEYSDYINQGLDVFRTYVEAWYNGTLHTIFFTDEIRKDMKECICSVLAGYVWDTSNPFVKKHKRALNNLAKVISMG